MNLPTAVRTCLNKYATFTGRATRSEFWWWTLVYWLLFIVVTNVFKIIFGETVAQIFLVIPLFGLLLPNIAVSVRRLHDTNKTGWFVLLGFVPIVGAIILIIFYATQGDAAENKYGLPPLLTTDITPIA